MASELILMAEPRSVLGKQVKALRREGLIPAVVYGPAVESTVQVSVNRRELERFYHAHGQSTLFTLKWEGGSQQVFIKEVQIEPLRRDPLHVDFFAPNLKKEITARVQVVLHNPAANADGVLNHLMDQIEVRALPAALPHQLEGDISGLKHPHDTLRAGDIHLPAGVVLVTDPTAIIAALVAQVVETIEPAEETQAAEGAAPAEEAAAEPEASADSE